MSCSEGSEEIRTSDLIGVAIVCIALPPRQTKIFERVAMLHQRA